MTSGTPRYQLSRRQAWFANTRTDADGDIPQGAHLAALRARARARAAARPEDLPSGSGGQWNPLGPAGVGLGQADGRPRVSGRVTSIAAHAGGKRAYIGTANGGTWYTSDADMPDVHWRCLDSYAQTVLPASQSLGESDALSVGAVAVAWGTDESTDVVYVGTGEANGSGDSYFGVGIRVATGPAAVVVPNDPTTVPAVPTWTLEATDLASKAIYQLAADPASSGVVYAATTAGLWRRTPGAAAGAVGIWTKVFDPPVPVTDCAWLDFLAGSSSQRSPRMYVTDVVIAPAGSGPQTIYVAVQDVVTGAAQHVWASQSGDSGTWQRVPGYTATDRVALAVSPTDPTVVYALSRGGVPTLFTGTAVPTNVARLVGGKFQPVTDTPTNLMGGAKKSQAYYDTVIAVDPVDPSVIWLGGSALTSPATGLWNASLFRGEVAAGAKAGTWTFGFSALSADDPARDLTWVGSGAHADVHALRFSGPDGTPTVWLGCDGGVFQSQVVTPPPSLPRVHGVAMNTAPGPWRALNDGLAITQPNYLAQAKIADFLMLAGTQDNGTQEHAGSAVWTVGEQGDGGGCAIDDANPSRRFAQYQGFTWYTAAKPGGGYSQTLAYGTAAQPKIDVWQKEDKYSAFYSQADARPLTSGVTALAFGSHRVWYCEDWGEAWADGVLAQTYVNGVRMPGSWRTLPTDGTNPYELIDKHGKPAPDLNMDSLHSQVVRVAFADDNQLLVLTQAWGYHTDHRPDPRPAALYLLTRPPGPRDPSNPKPWTLTWLSPPDPSKPAPPVPPPPAVNNFPLGEIPVGFAVDQPGPPLSCYVTLGAGQDKIHPGIDHVWWYDGSLWWPTSFNVIVADTPVNAVVVDADRTVYVGTDIGVYKGVPDTAGAVKNWTWSLFSNGLPEAPVLDLVLSQQPHLLRAATHGRGVWELNLDETAPVTQTYLRAHVADTRRAFPASVVPDGALFGPPSSRIDASPDIVVTGPEHPAPPADLPLKHAAPAVRAESVRVLQYALRRRQTAPAVPLAIDGMYNTETMNAVLDFQGTTAGLVRTGMVTDQDWQAIVMAPYTDAIAGADASYLDMALLERICPVPGPAGGPSLAVPAAGAQVFVQVNARGLQRRTAGSVRVGLLATPAFDATLATLPDLPPDWVEQFKTAVLTPPETWLTGSTSWAWAGSSAALPTTRDLHPEEPQVVLFTVTFPVPPGATVVPDQWTLLAVTDDPMFDALNTTVTNVRDLVLNDGHVAVRSVMRFA